MSKIKALLEKDMIENPELYAESCKIYEDFDFWMQCRKEELLEKEGEPKIIKKKKEIYRNDL